jgi:hypothetical protein
MTLLLFIEYISRQVINCKEDYDDLDRKKAEESTGRFERLIRDKLGLC